MDAKDVIRMSLNMSDHVVKAYLDGLSDEDLRVRPVAGMNPIAWQLGHLVESERQFLEMVAPGGSPALPDGFAAAHSKESASSGDESGFLTKDAYLQAWKVQREATLAALEGFTAEQLGQPSGVPFAPTFAAILHMIGSHALMHSGQFVAVRRALDKPVAL